MCEYRCQFNRSSFNRDWPMSAGPNSFAGSLSAPLVLTFGVFGQLHPQMSSTVVWVCRHIQSHVSKSLCLVPLDEVVGRNPCRGRTHRPRKASTKRGNYLRTRFQLGPPPPLVHPSMGVQLTTEFISSSAIPSNSRLASTAGRILPFWAWPPGYAGRRRRRRTGKT